MRILLTGGSGFLGSHIAEQLCQQGLEVRALVRPTSDTQFLERLEGVSLSSGALSEPETLQDAVRGVDGVIHAAGLVKARTPEEFDRTNHAGTQNLLDALRQTAPDLKRFVLVSSLAVTGPVPPDDSERPSGWWWGRWYEHENLRDERAEAFTSLLWPGAHSYSYVCRATTPGRFVVPPARAEEMYFPETFGRSASETVVVE